MPSSRSFSSHRRSATWLIIIIALCSSFLKQTTCSNILGLFPTPIRSHYVVFDALMRTLAEHGHNVTCYTTFPKPADFSLPNYTEVSLTDCSNFSDISGTSLADRRSIEKRASAYRIHTIPVPHPPEESIFNCEPLLNLRNLTGSFDLLITETFFNDFFAVFGHVLQVPLILIDSSQPFAWVSNCAALPDNPSYISAVGSGFSGPMNFFQRLQNTILYFNALLRYKVNSQDRYDRIVPRFFGDGAPRIEDAVRNASLLLLHTDFSLNDARPMVPNVVEIGGSFIKPAKKLPKDIEKFINESTHGVVYFCMGSILRGDSFPEEKRNAFLKAFARLPQRVLWKWEGDALPGKSDKIMVAKWMPQRDILAHPNVKLFISHGGLLGTSEAVYEGVPILGIPLFGDQKTNVKRIEVIGAGEMLDYTEISEEVVYEKVSRLVNDPRYKKNAVDLSLRYRDRPMSPSETAVYWTEYVIRHKGAHHLKTAAVYMPWYQYLLLDVIAFLVFVFVSAFATSYYAIKSIYKCFKPVRKVKTN